MDTSVRCGSDYHTAFQTIFGLILTVLIAVEFNHSLVSVLERRDGVVQVRMVLLIALLAVVRKFIVLEVPDVQPLTLIGLALTTLRTQCFQSRNECDGASTFDGCSIGNGEQAAPCLLTTDWL